MNKPFFVDEIRLVAASPLEVSYLANSGNGTLIQTPWASAMAQAAKYPIMYIAEGAAGLAPLIQFFSNADENTGWEYAPSGVYAQRGPHPKTSAYLAAQ